MTSRRRVHPKCERDINKPTGRAVHILFTKYRHIYSQIYDIIYIVQGVRVTNPTKKNLKNFSKTP